MTTLMEISKPYEEHRKCCFLCSEVDRGKRLLMRCTEGDTLFRQVTTAAQELGVPASK